MIRFSERFSGGSILKYIETMFFFQKPTTPRPTTHMAILPKRLPWKKQLQLPGPNQREMSVKNSALPRPRCLMKVKISVAKPTEIPRLFLESHGATS